MGSGPDWDWDWVRGLGPLAPPAPPARGDDPGSARAAAPGPLVCFRGNVALQCGQTRVGEPTTVLHPVHSLRPFPSGVPGAPDFREPLLSLLSPRLFLRRASSRDDEEIPIRGDPFGTDPPCSESFVGFCATAAAAAAAAAFAALFAAARAAAASRWPLAAASARRTLRRLAPHHLVLLSRVR